MNILYWSQLEDNIVRANTVESIKAALQHRQYCRRLSLFSVELKQELISSKYTYKTGSRISYCIEDTLHGGKAVTRHNILVRQHN